MLIHGDHPSEEISFEKRFSLYFPPRVHPRCSNNPSVTQSGLIPGITGEKTTEDNRENEDNGSAPIPELQQFPQPPRELGHIGPEQVELSGISSGELSKYLDFDSWDEWTSRGSLDYVFEC